jgi:hypothetical protein
MALGQNVVLSIGSGSGAPGGTVSLPITVASNGAQTAGLQWTFSYSSDITGVTVVAGKSTTDAGKSLSCSGNGNNCLVAGVNSTVIADGTVATATFQIAANPSSNPIAIQLTTVVATSATGSSIPANGGSGAISLPVTLALSTLNCTSASINTPGSTSCSVGLTGSAPVGGFTVSLSSNNASLTVPSSVIVAAGQTSNSFTATGAQVSSNQTGVVTASAGSVNLTSTLNLVAPAQLSSLACAPSSLGSNASSTCTVTLNKAATSAATVSLASALLTVPANVTVALGQSSATFAATSGTVSISQNATVTASLGGQSQQATISLSAAVQLSSLTCSPATVNAPGTSTCTVTLTAAASSTSSVTLSSTNTNVTVPGSVNITAGLSSATFTATVAAVTANQSALLTATLNGVSQSFTISATAPAPAQLTSLACAPSTLGSNASSTCTVTLSTTATSAATVSLASNNGLLTVPANITVASGQSSATFTAASSSVSSNQSATVTATLSGQSQQAILSLTAAVAAQLSGLTCSPGSVTGPGTSTCTATLSAAASSAASVTLSSNNTSVTVPGNVNISTGLSSATFTATIAAVTSNQNALLTATLNGGSQTFTLTAKSATKGQPKSLSCSPTAMSSHVSAKCSVSLNAATTTDSVVSIASSSSLLSVPANVTIPAGQSNATFDAISGNVGASQNATVTADLNGQSQQAIITLAAPVNCQEFQTSPGGLCMIQDVIPWVTFGGGWESRLSAGNVSNGGSAGTIQFSFTLLPAVPVTGGVQNHMPAFFKDSISGQPQIADNATYTLSAGQSVAVDFQSPPAGCDLHGQNCGSSADPNTSVYGSLLVQYVADNPASLRGIAKAQLALLTNIANQDYGWQTTEHEMAAANLWSAPVAVSANQTANPQSNQQASAALANPGASAITVRGTLYDNNGVSVTFRDFQIPAQGAIALVFSQDPSQPFGGFGQAMFPQGQDFNGLVAFQVTSPSGGAVAAMVLQDVGNAVSSVEVNSEGSSAASSSVTAATRCAEFAMAVDGSCSVQYTLPWVVFGNGWESRLKVGNPPSPTSGAVQARFTLVPAVSPVNGSQNHLPAYFTDNRTSQVQVGESANYTLSAGQSVDIHFLSPPAGCDSNGQNCTKQPDPNTLSFGSVVVQYSSYDPATLRRQSNPQLAFLSRPSGEAYSSQITERAAVAATSWTAPVAMSANPNANPQTYQQASAAINNPGSAPVTVRGTLRDQNGNVVTYNDFQIPAFGATGIVFSWDPNQPFGGFGNAAFPQGQDFSGWVTFDVTTQGSSGVSVLVLQYVGDTTSSVNVQSLP